MPDLPLIASTLYGPRWQSPLARALGVNIRTVQRWASGHAAPQPWAWRRLATLLDAHARRVRHARAAIRDHAH